VRVITAIASTTPNACIARTASLTRVIMDGFYANSGGMLKIKATTRRTFFTFGEVSAQH
jgi:hypothetical protein